MISHLSQLARVCCFCSGVADAKVNPSIFSACGGAVINETTTTTNMQNKNIQPQKKSQFMS